MSTSPVPTVASPGEAAALIAQLLDLGPPSELRGRAPALAASVLDFDLVLLTGISNGMLVAQALHLAAGSAQAALARLREQELALDYPLIEGEIMRRRRARVVHADDAGGTCVFADVLGWSAYAVAPLLLDGTVIGFFHAGRDASRRPLDESDASNLSSFAVCFALVYERAVLRHRLREQRHEMRQVASWADARTSELGDRSITLTEDTPDPPRAPTGESGFGEEALRDLLTRRELEVLRLMVRGDTNAAIAKDLVLSEGTVKFHVKSILRKLHAANRAEATSRYMRMTLRNGPDRH